MPWKFTPTGTPPVSVVAVVVGAVTDEGVLEEPGPPALAEAVPARSIGAITAAAAAVPIKRPGCRIRPRTVVEVRLVAADRVPLVAVVVADIVGS
jgi:hypothetical protein